MTSPSAGMEPLRFSLPVYDLPRLAYVCGECGHLWCLLETHNRASEWMPIRFPCPAHGPATTLDPIAWWCRAFEGRDFERGLALLSPAHLEWEFNQLLRGYTT